MPTNLFEHALGSWSVVNDTEGVHEIVGRWADELRQPLGIRLDELDAVRDAEQLRALPRKLERTARQIHGGHRGASAREVDRVGAESAANFQHAFAGPPLMLGKAGNVGLDMVLSGFNLIEVLAGSDTLRRVTEIARPAVPIRANTLD